MAEDLLKSVEGIESKVRGNALINNRDMYEYYRSLINALNISLVNSYQYIPKKRPENNFRLINYLVIPKYISISKAAIDIALNGHPSEAFTLTRLLLEYSQVTTCLTHHPELISRYLDGNVRLDEIRKILARDSNNHLGSKLFGLVSNYSHSTKEFLFLTFQSNETGLSNPIISENYEVIRNAIFSVVHYTWTQYISYRFVFRNDNITDNELRKLDKYLFDVNRMSQLFGLTTDNSLQKVSLFIQKLNK
jgi:hypothetical protein